MEFIQKNTSSRSLPSTKWHLDTTHMEGGDNFKYMDCIKMDQWVLKVRAKFSGLPWIWNNSMICPVPHHSGQYCGFLLVSWIAFNPTNGLQEILFCIWQLLLKICWKMDLGQPFSYGLFVKVLHSGWLEHFGNRSTIHEAPASPGNLELNSLEKEHTLLSTSEVWFLLPWNYFLFAFCVLSKIIFSGVW